MIWSKSWNVLCLIVLLLGLTPALSAASTESWDKVDPAILERLAANGETTFYVILEAQADLSGATALPNKVEKTAYVYEQLTETVRETQGPLLDYLEAQGVPFRSMYIQNMIRVQAGLEVVAWMAARPDVARVSVPPDPRVDPAYQAMFSQEDAAAIEWNVTRIGAPEVWAMGYRGEGMVVASLDTGVDYTHPALVGHYRGNLGGGSFDHNYSWWDCPGGSPFPQDDSGHGTHTTGTMVGDDGGVNQIGVASGAQWIACDGLDTCWPMNCFEFFLTPWDLNGENPDPARAPDAINNSWHDVGGFDYRPIIQALHAAGIAVIKSAGNWGPECDTINDPGYVPEVITVGSFDQNDVIAENSSRGPADEYGEVVLKPEVAAPGVDVRSSVPGNDYAYYSGTSMATPHVTGLVALIWQAAPCLRGDITTTKAIITATAEPRIADQCPPFQGHPNNVWGWGILDAPSAVQYAQVYCGNAGYLEGHVMDSTTGLPIEDANIAAILQGGSQWSTSTDLSGHYTLSVLPGSYTLTVGAYGYLSEAVGAITVAGGVTTTQSFSLTALPVHVISGTVTEVVSGTPLAAQVRVLNTPLQAVSTDPASGFYSLTVAQGRYPFLVTATHHHAKERIVAVDGDQAQDFELDPIACILLVDDDENYPDVRSYYTEALDTAGLEYDLWDVESQYSPSADVLRNYRMVLWFTGRPWGSGYPHDNPFNHYNEAQMAAYLDNGGNLFLSSENYMRYGLSYFGLTYLQITSFWSDQEEVDPVGNSDHPIGAGLGPYTLVPPPGWGTLSTDHVSGSQPSPFRWQGSGETNSTSYIGDGFCTLFFAWPLEGLPNVQDRSQILERIVDWFGGCLPCEPVQEVAFTWEPITPTVGQVVTFTAAATGTEPISYSWKFELRTPNFEFMNPITHVYTMTAVYTVTLTATNGCGVKVVQDSVTVEAAPPEEWRVYLPIVSKDG